MDDCEFDPRICPRATLGRYGDVAHWQPAERALLRRMSPHVALHHHSRHCTIPTAPEANAIAEHWVRSVRTECLDHAFIFNERQAKSGLSFDLSTASGKLMRTIMAGLAEFERALVRERVKSGLAAARARGAVLGRQLGQRPSDKKAKCVVSMHREGLSYRLIGRNLGLSKNTVMEIVRHNSAAA
jgi:hypothetical protein